MPQVKIGTQVPDSLWLPIAAGFPTKIHLAAIDRRKKLRQIRNVRGIRRKTRGTLKEDGAGL